VDATLAKLNSIAARLRPKVDLRVPESVDCPKCGTKCHPSDLDGPEVAYERMSAFTPKDEDEPIFYRKQVRHSVCGACIAEMAGVPYTHEAVDTSRRLRR